VGAAREQQPMTSDPKISEPTAASRAGVRRTVWILVACAVGSYLVFLYSVTGGK
jgi:hypothetical protein